MPFSKAVENEIIVQELSKHISNARIRGAPTGKFPVRPNNRTELIEAGYRSDLTLFSTVSNENLFSELGNEYDEKQSKCLL